MTLDWLIAFAFVVSASMLGSLVLFVLLLVLLEKLEEDPTEN